MRLGTIRRIACAGGLAVAGAISFAPAAAAKPFETKSKVLEYGAAQGGPAKTIYKGRLFSIKASCEDATQGTEIRYKARKNWFKREFLVRPDGYLSSTTSGDKGQTSTSAWQRGIGELVAFDPRLKTVATVDYLFHPRIPTPSASARLLTDCFWGGIVTEVGPRDLIKGKTEGSKDLDSPNPWDLSLDCVDQSATVSGVAGGGELVGINHFSTTNLEQRLYRPLSSPQLLIGNDGAPGFSDIGDIVALSLGAEALRFVTRAPDNPGGKCSAVGIDRTDTPQGMFSTDDARPRSVFYREEGLRLSASCDPGSMKVYASTTKPGSILGVSIIGDGTPAYSSYTDFSQPEADPEFVLNFANLSRNGQIGYVQPDGKTVFLNYVGRNSGSSCEFGVVSVRGEAF